MDGGVVSVPVAEAVLGSGLVAPAATGGYMGAGLAGASTGMGVGSTAGMGLGSGLGATATGGAMAPAAAYGGLGLGSAVGAGGGMGLSATGTTTTPLFGGPSANFASASTMGGTPGAIAPGFSKAGAGAAAPVSGQSTFQNAQMLRGLLNQQQRPRQPMMQPAPVQTTQVQMVPFGAISPYRR